MKKRLVPPAIILAIFLTIYGGNNQTQANTPMLAVPAAIYSENGATIDLATAADGYITVWYTGKSSACLKVLIRGPKGAQFVFGLNTAGNPEVFHLTGGDGRYTVRVCQNVKGASYTTLISKRIDVVLNDKFAPFLTPNRYVNYTADTRAVKRAALLVANAKATSAPEKVEVIYGFVIANFTYDHARAATIPDGYLPDLDSAWRKKSGVCLDIAAVTAAMLRSQDIPTKLVFGNTNASPHAWLEVFDGSSWQRLDPTLNICNKEKGRESFAKFIGDGKNYSVTYVH